ncbi:GFA family protein [soil metagenome]
MQYEGGCHCGAITFSLEAGDPITEVLSCNCSICTKRGSLLAFFPRGALTLKTPQSDVATYKFNKHVIAHHFCTVCGCAPFADGKAPDGAEIAAVNVRCLEGVDIDALKQKRFDGRSK